MTSPEMFSAAGNERVKRIVQSAKLRAERTSDATVALLGLQVAVRAAAREFPEIHDTEPECFIVEHLEEAFAALGHELTRDDLDYKRP